MPNFHASFAALVLVVTWWLLSAWRARRVRQQSAKPEAKAAIRRLPTYAEALSTADLEEAVFKSPSEYFDYIGPTHPDVVAYKTLLARRDLLGISRNWSRFCNSFLRLETARGHTGRPLLIDYDNSNFVGELCKRRIQALSTEELEAEVFHYDQDYFNRIGADKPAVVEFRRLVEQRNLAELRNVWTRLGDSFASIEESQHTPFGLRFVDVYHLHFESLVELCRRRSS
jgi:hypothetical protein